MNGPDDARTALDLRMAHAGEALEAVAGGRSMCAIGRSGHSFPAAKYHEGGADALEGLIDELSDGEQTSRRPRGNAGDS